jgi:outer membrane protein assembly factor BamB
MSQASWPQFRGPQGTGVVPDSADGKHAAVPLHWSESENIAWKCAIPHSGLSTPVVMNGKVWLTTATVEGHEAFVICVDADSGNMLLNKRLFYTEDPAPLGNNVNGYASPSPVATADRVYVSFGSTGTVCLDAKTYEVLWTRTDLPCRHYRGPGSSPVLFGDLLILTMDGVDLQYLVALDKKTGRTAWKTDRSADWDDLDAQGNPKMEGDLRKAYSTPLIIEINGRPQLVSAGAKAAYGYDPATGRELWKVRHRDHSSSASPVFGPGMVYVCTGFSKSELLAIRLGGAGDVTETHVAWRRRRAVPKMPSPLLVGDHLYTLADTGTLSCLEAETGREVGTQRLQGRFAASLLYLGGRIYCFNQKGVTTVLKEGPQLQVLAENELDGGFMASPAVAVGAFFLRTKTHLYRIESAR